MPQVYSDPSRESDPSALPDVEVFEVSQREVHDYEDGFRYMGEENARWLGVAGWYWKCKHCGTPIGPFTTEQEAITDSKVHTLAGGAS